MFVNNSVSYQILKMFKINYVVSNKICSDGSLKNCLKYKIDKPNRKSIIIL